jgi:hypothetical protein
MHLLFAALALGCIVLGFVGFGLGGIPTIVFWILAALLIAAAWKARPLRQKHREDQAMRER